MKTSSIQIAFPGRWLALLLGWFFITATHAGTVTNSWSGAGADENWSTAGNWDFGVPGVTSTVFFTATDPAVDQYTSNNVVDASVTIDSLFYRNTNAVQTTYIPGGNTLAITGQVAWTYALVNVTNSFFCGPYPDQSATVTAAILGEGTLLVTNPLARMSIRNANGAIPATLNLSNLSTFIAVVDRLTVGAEGNNAPANRPTGILRLARTNYITGFSTVGTGATAALTIGEAAVNSGAQSIVTMGYTNVFLADSGITVGGARNIGRLEFGVPGVAYFRNRVGTGRQGQWGVGDNNTGSTGTSSTGVADLTGGTVDAMVSTIYVGRGEAASNVGLGTGTMLIGSGIVDVNDLRIGYMRTAGGGAVGTVTTSGGASVTNLIVNNELILGRDIGAANAVGTLNIGSAVVVKGNITGGGGVGNTLTLDGGSLSVGGRLGNNTGANDQPLENVNLTSGTLNLSLGTAGNPVTPVCNVSNLNITAVTLNLSGAGLSPGIVPVMKYYASGSFAGITPGALPAQTFGYLSNSTDTLYLVITNVDSPKWNGNVSGDWDINTTTNWLTGVLGVPTTYKEATVPGDSVLFDDTASGTTTVNLTTTLSPLSMTVNNASKSYAFGGNGRLSGAAALSKQGTGTLLITNSGVNDFSGAVSVAAGTVRLGGGDNRLPTNAVVNLADVTGATLDLNGVNQQLGAVSGGGSSGGNISLGTATLTLSGNGNSFAGVLSGAGKLVKIGGGNQILAGDNTYSGGTTISNGTLSVANTSGSGISTGNLLIAGGTLEIGIGTAAGSVAQTIITNNGTLRFNRSDDLVFNKTIVGSGGLQKVAPNIVFLSPGNTYTGTTAIQDGALHIEDATAVGLGQIAVGTTGPARLEITNNVTLNQTILLQAKSGTLGAPPHIQSLGGTNTLNGPLGGTGTTEWSFQSDDGLLIVNSAFTNAGGSTILNLRGAGTGEWRNRIPNGAGGGAITALTKRDAGTWILTSTSTNTYTGVTTLLANGGTLVVNGAILNSLGIAVGVNSTLAGNGLIMCGVTNGPLSFISPGNSMGALTISNWLSLSPSATLTFEVGDNQCDQIRGLTGVILGGTLQVSVVGNIYGTEAFKLIDAQSYNGNFSATDLPALPPPLGWDLTDLETQGILRVSGGIKIGTNALVGGQMTLSGTGPVGVAYRVLASTNVTLPANLWTEVGSGTFAGDSSFSFTDTNTTAFTQRFYRVVTP